MIKKEKLMRSSGCAALDISLIRAARQGNLCTANAAIASGADVDAVVDNETPLSLAVYHGHSDVARALIAADASVALRGVGGMPPLVAAAAAASVPADLIKLLVASGADVNRCVDPLGMTALMAAAKGGTDGSVVSLLLRLGADPAAVDLLGRTALDYARNSSNTISSLRNATLIETVILERHNICAAPALSAKEGVGSAHI